MKVKRKKLDILFSNLVRERSNWYCQACSTNKLHDKQTLDCAHIFSRRNLVTRYHPKNAVALCRACHMFYTEHPFDWHDWVVDYMGPSQTAKLRKLSNTTIKWTGKQREEIYQFYKLEYEKMKLRRLSGEETIIGFPPHRLML